MGRESEQHELQARESAARAEAASLRVEVESLRAEAGAARSAAESARVEGEAARSRFSFLAEASRVLGTSLDYETTAKDLLAVVKTKKTELLFMALFLKLLKPGLATAPRCQRKSCTGVAKRGCFPRAKRRRSVRERASA